MTLIHDETPDGITHSDGPDDARREAVRAFTEDASAVCAARFPRSYLAVFLFTPVEHEGLPNVAIDYYGNVEWPHLRDLLLRGIELHDRAHAAHAALKGEAQGNG